jgi:hypothetical protein
MGLAGAISDTAQKLLLDKSPVALPNRYQGACLSVCRLLTKSLAAPPGHTRRLGLGDIPADESAPGAGD